jgi:hypothetical protein
VPWVQGPSCACSRRSRTSPNKGVVSAGRCLLGPAAWR